VRRYHNAEFGAVLAAASTEMNEARRLELLHRAAQIMYEDPPFLFLVETFNLWAASPKLEGIRSRIDGEPNVPAFRFKP
jgi:oligopeptide transport system substrate-binding protein